MDAACPSCSGSLDVGDGAVTLRTCPACGTSLTSGIRPGGGGRPVLTPPVPELPPELAARYRTIRRIGRGATADVVLAESHETGAPVAIKLLSRIESPTSRE